MKKIILHIGRHKSGTTSLQKTFGLNREKLKSVGVLYPLQGVRDDAHHLIAERLAKVNLNNISILESDQLLLDFLSGLKRSDQNIFLISSEAFQNCKPDIVRAYFKGFDLNVVFYIREQLSYLRSAYQQKVHATDYCESIEVFENAFDADYYKFYSCWTRVFLSENIFLRVFSRERLYKGDVVLDFFNEFLFKKLGIKVEVDAVELNPLTSNFSLMGDALNFKLRLNRFLAAEVISDPLIYKVLGEISARKKQRQELINSDLFVRVKEKYDKSNDKLLSLLNIPAGYLNIEGSYPLVCKTDIGPVLFRRILDEVVTLCPALGKLKDFLYWVSLSERRDAYLFSVSKNISFDALNHLYIERVDGSLIKVSSVLYSECGEFFLSKNVFDFIGDRFVLKFSGEVYALKLFY